MARVRVKGLRKVRNLFNKVLDDSLTNRSLVSEVGNFILERIRSFTRSGKSIAGSRPKKLKKLSSSYISVRQGAVKFRTLKDGRVIPITEPDEILKQVDPEFFDPNFSNLTLTGQMLRSLKFFFDKRNKKFTIEPTGNRRRVLGQKKRLTNKQVANFVSDNGRPFIGLDDKGIERVRKMIIKSLRSQLRSSGLRRK